MADANQPADDATAAVDPAPQDDRILGEAKELVCDHLASYFDAARKGRREGTRRGKAARPRR